MPDVRYSLHVEGSPAEKPLLKRLQRVEVEEHADVADMLRLELATSVKVDEGGWSVVDDGVFEPFTRLRVGLQVGKEAPTLLLDAYVIDVNVRLSNAPGQSTLEVVAMDHTALMNREETRKRWEMRHSTIAETIFGEYDLAPRTTRTEPGEQELGAPVMQRGTDAQLLKQLADRNGYVFYVETNPRSGTKEGHFHPLEREDTDLGMETQPPLRVSMGPATNVSSFDVRHEMSKPFKAIGGGVKARSRKKKEATAEATESSLGRTSTLRGKRAKKFVSARFGQRGGDLQSYGQVASRQSSYAVRATGRLRIVDYEHLLRAKRPVQVEGAGDKFSVQYYVEKVQHSITEDEYSQEFTLRSNALGAPRT